MEQWYPHIQDVAHPEVAQAIRLAYERIYQLSASDSHLAQMFQKQLTGLPNIFGPAAIRAGLQADGKYSLNVEGLLGKLAQPQIGGVATGTATPSVDDPVSQDGALFVKTPTNTLYYFKETTDPGIWTLVAATAVIQFGTRAAMPAAGNSGYVYFQTDTGWLYYDDGSNFLYGTGIDVGTDATRSAITVGTNDNNALFITTDTKRLWRVEAGAWANKLGFTPTFTDNELPTGAINGINVTYTLAASPSPAASLLLFLNGVLQQQGAAKDYTISGATITMVTAPSTGDILIAYYRS